MRIICTLILLAMLTGCSHKHTVQVGDVSKPEMIILKPSQGQSAEHITGISLRFHGQIDGEAMISGTNVLTQKLTGVFDLKTGGDWYSGSCQLQYSPTNVHSGQVVIEYEFYD
jgi:uncharacterized lipoprotein YmbA